MIYKSNRLMIRSISTAMSVYIKNGSTETIEEAYGDFLTNFSASISCISNIGPGFGLVGPASNFSGFSYFSKVVLSLEMLLAGDLPLDRAFLPRHLQEVAA